MNRSGTPRGHAHEYLPLALHEAESKEFAVFGTGDGAFLLVHFELEFLLQIVPYSRHDPFSGPGAFDVDVAVVGVPHEAMPPLFECFVEVVQQDVGQKRRKGAALRGSLRRSAHRRRFP